MNEQLLVVGDVHGCFYTFQMMIAEHWRVLEEVLVQVGDLIDLGNYSPDCVATARSRASRFPGRADFLKGNHEFERALCLRISTTGRILELIRIPYCRQRLYWHSRISHAVRGPCSLAPFSSFCMTCSPCLC